MALETSWRDPTEDAATLEKLAAAQAASSLALGRLDGRLRSLLPLISRTFAVRIIRSALHAVLTQEGHRFTEARFATWYAGLTTLSDEPLQFAPAPRGLAEAFLSELARSHWGPLNAAARQFEASLRAPREPGDASARADAMAAIEEAGELANCIPAASLPFPGLAAIHKASGQSVRFALRDRAPEVAKLGNLHLVLDRPRPPSPRWPLELACGIHLHVCGLLPASLPLIGIIRLDAIEPGVAATRTIHAEALAQALGVLSKAADDAVAIEADAASLSTNLRTHSRAPQLYALLRALGPLRSAQIEPIVGATRLGVRKMLSVLEDAGALGSRTIAGAKLYCATPLTKAIVARETSKPEKAFSQAALNEYDASMAEIDALLTR